MRIKFLYEDRSYPFHQIKPILDYSKYFLDYDLKITNDRYKIIVGHHTVLTDEQLEKENVVVIERADSACLINDRIRRVIDRPNILGVIKTTVVNPRSLMNCGHRYHYKLIDPSLPNVVPDIPETALDKFKCLVPISMQYMFADPWGRKIDFDDTRIHDVVYLASPLSDVAGTHRRQFSDKAHALKNNKIVGIQCLARHDWLKLLRQTKICISPWGYGEMCYRDFDAIYSGCVLLKPDSDFVECYPNIYQKDKYYKACRQDASDLQEVVDQVINNWNDHRQMRVDARNLLMNFWNHRERAKDFAAYIKGLYESHNLY